MAMTEKLIFVLDDEMKDWLIYRAKFDNKSQAEIVRELVREDMNKWKRVICVQHSGGRVEIDPEAK